MSISVASEGRVLESQAWRRDRRQKYVTYFGCGHQVLRPANFPRLMTAAGTIVGTEFSYSDSVPGRLYCAMHVILPD